MQKTRFTKFSHVSRAIYKGGIFRTSIASLTFAFTGCAQSIPDGPVTAPTTEAKAVNQRVIDKNGCGPTSLMNAYRFGSPAWHVGYDKLGANIDSTNKQKFTDLVNRFGIHISRHNGMVRWDKRNGISTPDLCDMANDYQRSRRTNLPQLSVYTHFNPSDEANVTLLQDVHKKLRNSMLKGFPPILTIKRFTQRSMGGFLIWKQVHGHFVTLYEIPGRIAPEATSFKIKYVDPWGGRILTGTVKIPEQSFYAIDSTLSKNLKFRKSPTLVVDFPHSSLGRHLIRKGERNVAILASSITP